jgi:hypothetical protein
VTERPDDDPLLPHYAREFDAAGMRAAREQLDRRRPRRRGVVILASALTIVVVGGGGAFATRSFIGDDGSRGSGINPPRSARPVPGALRVAEVRVDDPIKSAPPWGIRIYPHAGGHTCALAGRVVDGRLGRLRDGQFAEYAPSAQGACADVARRDFLATVRCDPQVVGGRSALYGLVDREVVGLDLAPPAGPFRRLRPASDGSFLVVRRGRSAFHNDRLRITKRDGITTVRLQVARWC